jgi:hypothetical protein
MRGLALFVAGTLVGIAATSMAQNQGPTEGWSESIMWHWPYPTSTRRSSMPPSWEGYRNEYAMEAAKKWPKRFAVYGPPAA